EVVPRHLQPIPLGQHRSSRASGVATPARQDAAAASAGQVRTPSLFCARRNAEKPMILIRLLRALTVCLALVAPEADAQPLDKVSFGTNWVAEADHAA